MKKIYVLIFCILLIGCAENNITSENTNEEADISNQIANEVVEETEEIQVVTYDSDSQNKNVDEEAFSSFSVDIRVDQLNVRSEPSIESEKISKVSLDEQYIVKEKHVNDETGEYWYQIELDDGTIGWIAGWFATKSGVKYITLYSEMSFESDRMAFVENTKMPEFKLSGIYSDSYAMKWYKTEFLGQTLYSEDYYNDTSIVTWPIVYKTNYSNEEFVFSEDNPGKIHFGYREVFIESSDGLIYIDTEQRKVYREDKSLGQTSYEFDMTLSQNRSHILPEGYLFISEYRTRTWLYGYEELDIWCYEIVDNRLKERETIQFEFTKDNMYIHAYDSPYKTFNLEIIKYEYSGYVNQNDILDYRRYYDGYSFLDVIVVNIDGKEMYAPFDANRVDEDITVFLSNGDRFTMPAKSTIVKSPLYKKGYINYRMDNHHYTKNYKNDFVMPYSRLFYINDQKHMLLQEGSSVYIYDVRSSETVLVKEFESSEAIREISESDDFIIVQNSSFSNIFLSHENGSFEILYGYETESPVFETMDLTSSILRYDSLENRKDYEVILEVLDDRLNAWYRCEDGYILIEVYNRNHNNEGYSLGYIFDYIVNSKGQIISGDLTSLRMKPTEVINSPCMIVYSSEKYYSLRLDTEEINYLGTDVKHILNTDYILTYSEDDKGSTIDLYRIGQTFEHLDSYETNMIGGKLSQRHNEASFVKYSDFEGLITVNDFIHQTVVFEVHENRLKTNIEDGHIMLDAYEAANYKSNVIMTFTSSDMINPVSIDRFQLMDGEIILWYEISDDNGKYYVYKKLKQMEFAAYDREMLEILLDDDSIIGFSTGGECAYYLVYDNLGHEGYLSIYHAWEGIYGTVIDMKTGRVIHGMPYNPKFSPNGRHIFSYEYEYDSYDMNLNLFNIVENDIEEVISYNIDYWNIQSAEWLSNDEVLIEMFDEQFDTFRSVSLIRDGEVWLLRDNAKEGD